MRSHHRKRKTGLYRTFGQVFGLAKSFLGKGMTLAKKFGKPLISNGMMLATKFGKPLIEQGIRFTEKFFNNGIGVGGNYDFGGSLGGGRRMITASTTLGSEVGRSEYP